MWCPSSPLNITDGSLRHKSTHFTQPYLFSLCNVACITLAASCNDGWVFGWLVSGLRDTCGLQQDYRMYDGSRDGVANNSWVRYRGDLMMYYTEMVTLPINNGTATQQLTRYAPVTIIVFTGCVFSSGY